MIFFSIIIAIIIFGSIALLNILPELYWFDSFGYNSTYFLQIGYQYGLLIGLFFTIFSLYLFNEWVVRKIINKAEFIIPNEPSSAILKKFKELLDQLTNSYQGTQHKFSATFRIIGFAFLSFLTAKYGAVYWNDIILYLNSSQFGITDPVFGKDIGFYVFSLPVFSHFLGIIKFLFIVCVGYSIWRYINHAVIGLIFTTHFRLIRAHIFCLLALLFLTFAVTSFLDRFYLLFKNNEILYGLSYTDFNYYLKAIGLMPLFWLLLSVTSIILIFRLSTLLLTTCVGSYFVIQILFLSLIPSLIQNYIVSPNEFKKEKPFIMDNIKFTQMAYQLDNIKEVDINYKKNVMIEDKSAVETILDNARLWNPGPLKSTLKQLQEIRLYYEFKNIDIDRYVVNGKKEQIMLSARELDVNQIPQKAQTWVNRHLSYTHGYGLCMVPVNRFNEEGLPELYVRDIPPVSNSNIIISRPEIYFGEATNHYVIVNTKQKEFDYPKDNENRYTNYSGTGGIQLSSLFKRALYAFKMGDIKLLISQNIHDRSRLMFDRNVHQIPKKIAPFIIYDNDPYMVVHNGRLVWMIDGYTTSKFFPYSTPFDGKINYIRNSVVVTVDAYSGETNFYVKDANDPIITAHKRAYPQLFKPFTDMPTDLQTHIRFPKDLFKIISKVYNTYHMNDPQVFYNKEDVWTFPTETYDSDTGIIVDPYYMFVKNPTTGNHDYVMIMPLTPSNKNNLVSVLTASSEPSNFGQFTIYKYPKQETVYGPLQIESRIDQNTEISKDLTLWGQVGSRVIRGNLMVIPYENSVFYVEPIYLQATQSKLPELKRVILAAGDKVTMSPTLEEGIQKLANIQISKTSKKSTQPVTSVNNLTKKIIDVYSNARKNLRSADWVNFGEAFDELDKLIQQLRKEN